MIVRENIYAALFAAATLNLQTNGVVTISRRLKHWADVPSDRQPAVYMLQRQESVNPETPGELAYWTFKVDLYVYVWTAPDKNPGPIINPIIDLIHANFIAAQNSDGSATLGGLVMDAYIDGTIETSEGCLGDQEVAIIPVTVKLYA